MLIIKINHMYTMYMCIYTNVYIYIYIYHVHRDVPPLLVDGPRLIDVRDVGRARAHKDLNPDFEECMNTNSNTVYYYYYYYHYHHYYY